MADVMNGQARSQNGHLAEANSRTCIHHWVLGEASQGAIRGACRRCGATRTFPAMLEVPPPPQQPEEQQEEEAPTLDMPALAAAVSSVEKHALI